MNNNSTNTCPRGTAWCTEHEPDEADQCVSTPIDVAEFCSVWLLLGKHQLDPVLVVDAAISGADLSMDQALDLSDAIKQLRQAALTETAVES